MTLSSKKLVAAILGIGLISFVGINEVEARGGHGGGHRGGGHRGGGHHGHSGHRGHNSHHGHHHRYGYYRPWTYSFSFVAGGGGYCNPYVGSPGPGVGPGPNPGFGPGAGPGPGVGPGSNPGFSPGAGPGPGVGAGPNPGFGPGAGSGVGPGSGPGFAGPNPKTPPNGRPLDTSPIAPPQKGQQFSKVGMDLFAAARDAFRVGDYPTAKSKITTAVIEMPKNPDAQQFRSLILFAMQDYSQSASAAHVALTAGQGWAWRTLQSFYTSADLYTPQYRSLQNYVKSNPGNAGTQFLLAYHNLMLGHDGAARRQLVQVVELEPKDKLSVQLLQMLPKPVGPPANSAPKKVIVPSTPVEPGSPILPSKPQQPSAPNAPSKPVETNPTKPVETNPTKPVETNPTLGGLGFMNVPAQPKAAGKTGTWTASPSQRVTIKLTLNTNETFVWVVSNTDGTNQFSGKFTLTNNVLSLIRKNDNQKLIAMITTTGEDSFNFKSKEAKTNDPGLSFTR